jgi:hypothetical protein
MKAEKNTRWPVTGRIPKVLRYGEVIISGLEAEAGEIYTNLRIFELKEIPFETG